MRRRASSESFTLGAILVLAAASACSRGAGSGAARRATLRAAGPASIEILPAEGQPPFCLAFSVSETGLVRQLTTSPTNESLPCPANQPIGGTAYPMPPAEGKVRIHVVFSDRKLDATPIAAQMHELGSGAGFSAMDLRAPGRVLLETLSFPDPR